MDLWFILRAPILQFPEEYPDIPLEEFYIPRCHKLTHVAKYN